MLAAPDPATAIPSPHEPHFVVAPGGGEPAITELGGAFGESSPTGGGEPVDTAFEEQRGPSSPRRRGCREGMSRQRASSQ